ncbi:HEPN domain-containing protein [Methanosphaerula palustris]|uniref:HEPN domain-containing protein n=1 Tax=Methanosphaerula palustris TaxID=475088 RepID=UPI000BA4B5E8
MRRAHSSLSIAHCCRPKICLEDLCFQAQQAAEKAIKAVFIVRALPLPYIHDISDLLHRLERSGLPVPDAIKSAPSFEIPVGDAEYTEALAESVVLRAENILNDKRS